MKKIREILRKDQIFTWPNFLSSLRIAMIPMILWLYCAKKAYRWAVLVIAVSGLTDIVDGFMARHFHMTSDFGKILDPIADKMTQVTVLFCLTSKYPLMLALVTLFVVREIAMFTMGLLVMKQKDEVSSAKWHGKVNTVILYTVVMALILFPYMPSVAANILILLCAGSMLASLVLYTIFYVGRLRRDKYSMEDVHG